MYTQCPDCGVAFRVTADVLKQAAGKVRCGGCGIAFNALEHLSETKPESPVKAQAEAPLPELKPDLPAEADEDKRPKAISAEQSAALLKTLDQLAGEDIRIEDTGVEWRVLGVDEEDDADDADAATPAIDEERAEHESVDVKQSVPPEEMRFDDNTPLPDDFDFDSEPEHAAPEPPPIVETEPPPNPDEAQVDLALGDPDEWEDLLGEVGDGQPGGIEVTEAVEDEAPAEAELEAGTPADQPLDMDTQFALQAEALGVDLTGMHAKPDFDGDELPPAEQETGDTSIEEDLIAAAFEAEAVARAEVSAAEALLDASADAEQGEPAKAEVASQLVEAANAEADAPLEDVVGDEPDAPLEDIVVAESDAPLAEAVDAALAATDEPLEERAGDDVDDMLELRDEDIPDAAVVETLVTSIQGLDSDDTEADDELKDELHRVVDDTIERELAVEPAESADIVDGTIERALAAEPEELAVEEIVIEGEPEQHVVPKMTDDEKTVNMMIDQDLLAIAVEDDEGFTSTIVQKQTASDDEEPKDDKKKNQPPEIDDEPEEPKSGPPPFVETIIMEGETVRGEHDPEEEAARASFMQQARAMAKQMKSDQAETPQTGIGLIAAIVALLLLLAAQIVHQSRESLATVPAFRNTISPLYRTIGSPVTPDWDVSGWRFEATKGSTDENDEQLTIYSRVGNASDEALPYPLVHVSLTDRFEEIIGSRVLEPAEYLVGDPDPRKAVQSGESFNAVIAIESPAPEATGFKLNVCYRMAGGQLKCAIEDFK